MAQPVIFIHGLWLHASSWQPWLDLFTEAGYAPIAPGWPGEPSSVAEARQHPEGVAGHGIDEVTEHYAHLIDWPGEVTVLTVHGGALTLSCAY